MLFSFVLFQLSFMWVDCYKAGDGCGKTEGLKLVDIKKSKDCLPASQVDLASHLLSKESPYYWRLKHSNQLKQAWAWRFVCFTGNGSREYFVLYVCSRYSNSNPHAFPWSQLCCLGKHSLKAILSVLLISPINPIIDLNKLFTHLC